MKKKSIIVLEYKMSDNYEFEKSSRPQDVDGNSPYVDKQYNGFINDLNSGVYTNTSFPKNSLIPMICLWLFL